MLKTIIVRLFAITGALALGLLAVGITVDALAFDRTRGGYEAPYTDFTGPPIDWTDVATTRQGMVGRGYVVDVEIDCTTGMMVMEVFGLRIPFRTFSERAIAVHKPREECAARGFTPAF